MSARRPKVRTYERAPGKWSVIWRELGRQLEERGYESEDEASDRADEIRQRLRTGLPGARQHRTIDKHYAYLFDEDEAVVMLAID
jgi:hypothetical protein